MRFKNPLRWFTMAAKALGLAFLVLPLRAADPAAEPQDAVPAQASGSRPLLLSGRRVGPRKLFGMGVVVSLVAALSAAAGSPSPLTVQEVMAAPHAPVLEVVDTVSSLGPLAARPQTITIADLVRFHGHPCDGLVAAAAGMAYGLQRLFPGGIVDRTDLAVTVNRSACYGDVAAYLTGARHRYGSLVIDPKLGDEWILRRRSTGTAVRVRLRPGIKPSEIPALEKKLRHADCPPDLIAHVQQLQRSFALAVVSKPPAEVFEATTFKPADAFPGTPRPDALKRGCPCKTGGARG